MLYCRRLGRPKPLPEKQFAELAVPEMRPASVGGILT